MITHWVYFCLGCPQGAFLIRKYKTLIVRC